MAAKVGSYRGGGGGGDRTVVAVDGGAGQGDDAGASAAVGRFFFVIGLADPAGSDGILGAHHLGPVVRVLGAAKRGLGDGIPVGGEDTGVPLTVLFVEDGVVVSFLGCLALLDVAGIHEMLEATDADALGADSTGASACDAGDNVELIALVVLFGGEAGLEFLIGVFVESRNEVDLRPAVEGDTTRTMAAAKMVASRAGGSMGGRSGRHDVDWVCCVMLYVEIVMMILCGISCWAFCCGENG